MNLDEQRYFDNARDMFLTEGWKQFIEELETWADSITFDSCNSSDEFWKAKGALSSIRRALRYEDMVKQAEQEADDESYS